MLGEFNARVGADYNSWSRSIGHFGIGKLYENGQRLLELCSYHDLCITNTFFSTKLNHRVSWRHPRSHHWHQLDLVITRRPLLNCVLVTRSHHSADCDTDPSLVSSKVRLQPKRTHRSKQKIRPRIKAARNLIFPLFSFKYDPSILGCPGILLVTCKESKFKGYKKGIKRRNYVGNDYGSRASTFFNWITSHLELLKLQTSLETNLRFMISCILY